MNEQEASLKRKEIDAADQTTEDSTAPNKKNCEEAAEEEPSAMKKAADVVHTIVLENLPPFLKDKQVLKWMYDLKVPETVRVKKAPKWTYATALFESEIKRDEALGLLNDKMFKKNTVLVKPSTVAALPINVDRKPRDGESAEDSTYDPSVPIWEHLNDKVTPFWRLAYPEQLEKKELSIKKVLNKFRNAISKVLAECRRQAKDNNMPSVDGYDWTRKHMPMSPIVGSPEEAILDYRNKCELSIGTDPNGKFSVGFMLGNFKNGITTVASPEKCVHISLATKVIAEWMQEYIETESQWNAYDRNTAEGNWRLIMTRTQLSGDVMVMAQMHPQNMTADDVTEEKRKLTEFLELKSKTEGAIKVSTLLWQMSDVVNHMVSDKDAIEVVTGPGTVTEKLKCQFQTAPADTQYLFQISPLSFFQSSTRACEVLYGIIGDWVNQPLTEDTPEAAVVKKKLLLDLCCGTGTIGIALSHLPNVTKIVGVEMNESAIEDAKGNAALNNVQDKIEFICKPVEKAMGPVLRALPDDEENVWDVVAVLDPPRSGVNPSVLISLRASKHINRIIYVSCNPEAASKNWLDLCRPGSKRIPGKPFRLSRSQPVDMFPATEHCEMILEFVR